MNVARSRQLSFGWSCETSPDPNVYPWTKRTKWFGSTAARDADLVRQTQHGGAWYRAVKRLERHGGSVKTTAVSEKKNDTR